MSLVMTPEHVFSRSDCPGEVLSWGAWERFQEDCVLAGQTVEFVEGKLGVVFDRGGPVPQFAQAYVELLLALKDGRHPW
jgi:hypothetical protein